MVFEFISESRFHHIDKLEPGPPNVYFMDVFTSEKSNSNKDPLTGSMFLLEHSETNDPAPKYDYDETGVVVKGELHIADETGNKQVLVPGDTFFIHRGSLITFSTPKFAVAYKTAARVGHVSQPKAKI
ncbi:hypothetical protein K491DRAFT_696696 [Lophiostoma macrostomum CBS 122681]|uniref:(S)-ureidoglycine aminohydrolase cupin domain-containing protein n=1 Tax=Lophiostoma macrostomum CBS 122681 TaxID=1314788 RepID=A0A6A6SVZ0_9PLEO|nr:hypothetical protein K491DRAFT_696696 [Lophiostoma macrostomum CBS 122681]